jgi:hypothetical protein
MPSCLVCGVDIRFGGLCRAHAEAAATCEDITAQQVVSSQVNAPSAWLIDQWGIAHAMVPGATVGRDAGAVLAILHPSVSLVHAELTRGEDGWLLVDRGSLNGTYVADERVREAPLSVGALVRFGDVGFFFSDTPVSQVRRAATTGGTLPSKVEEIALTVTLEHGPQTLELIERAGGGVVRGAGSTLELARLEFGLLAMLVRGRLAADDPERGFVASRELADGLDFQTRVADGENVRELVRRVRRKLDAAGFKGLIESRQRVGYRLGWRVLPTAEDAVSR